MRRRASSGSTATSTPATRAEPDVIVISVVNILTVVDLPAPFGPEEAEDLPGRDLEVDAAHRLDGAAASAVVLDELLGFHG